MKIKTKDVMSARKEGKKVVMIDVRTPVEHEEERVPGSVLMPLDGLDAEAVKKEASGADMCVLVCRSGKRAEQAYEKLKAAGCDSLAILEGGVMGWDESELPLVRSRSGRLPLMRQVQLIIGVLSVVGSVLALMVDVRFALLPAFLGAGLTMAGATGWCGLAILLSKMPWNKVAGGSCEVKSCSI